jgi:predicted protein tyrosine phosphatase
MKILFICNMGMHRSRTAEDLFKDKIQTKSAGIYSHKNPLTEEKIDWADIVIVMEDHQRTFIADNFPIEYLSNKIISLNIQDIYTYNDPDLKKILKNKMNKIIKETPRIKVRKDLIDELMKEGHIYKFENDYYYVK